MAIRYDNQDDIEAERARAKKSADNFLNRGIEAFNRGENPFSVFDDNDIELDSEYDSIGQLIQVWQNTVKKVNGTVTMCLTDESVTTNFKIVGFAVEGDDLTIKLEIEKNYEITANDFLKQLKQAIAKYHLRSDAGYSFNFRGNTLEVESVIFIPHDDDDDATFSVIFTNSSVNSKKKRISSVLTAEDLTKQIDRFCNEYILSDKKYCDALKVVCIIDDEDNQQVFQMNYPRVQDGQIVFNLSKCQSWRFKEIENDPETMTVAQLKQRIAALHSDGYIFMKAKDQTYGISGIDMLESQSSLDDEGRHEVIALKLKPWSELFESKHIARKMKNMKKKYTKRQILESIKYWRGVLNRMDESLRVSLADKQSVTQALLDHNDELTAFIDQKPHPTKDELIQFVADIFAEEGLDTPWTRQFLLRLKMYVHTWNDAVQYLWNARLKGQQLGMDQGLHHGRGTSDSKDVNEAFSEWTDDDRNNLKQWTKYGEDVFDYMKELFGHRFEDIAIGLHYFLEAAYDYVDPTILEPEIVGDIRKSDVRNINSCIRIFKDNIDKACAHAGITPAVGSSRASKRR